MGKIKTEFATLKPKLYIYLTGYINENEKPKGTKNCDIEQKL